MPLYFHVEYIPHPALKGLRVTQNLRPHYW